MDHAFCVKIRHVNTNHTLQQLQQRVIACAQCADLRAYCAEVGRTRRKAYADWEYWARPVPGFGDPAAKLVIVGLAPAAHGANRTGRMFTGDRSGDFLYAALHRAGLANQPDSVSREDGLDVSGAYITAALRCAPPANKPTAAQLTACRTHLVDELEVLRPRVLLCLGGIGWNAALAALKQRGMMIPSPRPKFGHGAEIELHDDPILLGCYHVSQQNTFTGRLTEPMIDAVLQRATALCATG